MAASNANVVDVSGVMGNGIVPISVERIQAVVAGAVRDAAPLREAMAGLRAKTYSLEAGIDSREQRSLLDGVATDDPVPDTKSDAMQRLMSMGQEPDMDEPDVQDEGPDFC